MVIKFWKIWLGIGINGHYKKKIYNGHYCRATYNLDSKKDQSNLNQDCCNHIYIIVLFKQIRY